MVRTVNLADALEVLRDENFTQIGTLLTLGKFVMWQKEQVVNLPPSKSGNMVFVIKGVLAISNVGQDGSHGACISVFPGGFLNVGPDADKAVDQVINAVTDVSVVVVSNQVAKDWMTENLTSATAMLEFFHKQSRLCTETLKIIGAHSVQERAAGFIEQFARHHEPNLADKQGRTYRWDISQQGFATLIGTNRSHLSVVLGKMRESGEAIINGRTLLIPKASSISV